MALLESINVPLGSSISNFELKDAHGQPFQSSNLFGEKGLLIAFTCNHCPYAVAVWPRLITLAEHAKTLGIQTVAINPNIHPNYPGDAPDKMIVKIKEWGIHFPYLVDETQEVAKSFDAQCTPDIYLYNSKQQLAYHGRIDDNWQDASKVTRQELKEAIDSLASGKEIAGDQKPTIGCSIKWK